MSSATLLVTGASGQLGRRVVEHLLELGPRKIIATTRNPDTLAGLRARGVDVRRADFDDDASLASAFQGATRALLISTDAIHEPGRRLAQHRQALQALQAAGVQHVVYTSLPNPVGSPIAIAPDHAQTEALLAAFPLDYTVLRNNIYAEILLASLPAAAASGQLVYARGDGAVAYVTREDCARVAAAALADEALHGRRTLDVTGAQAWTGDQLAALLSELLDRNITHTSVTNEQYIEGLVAHGVPRAFAELFASFERGAARGDLATVTDVVQRFTGAQPQSLRTFLQAHRGAFEPAQGAAAFV